MEQRQEIKDGVKTKIIELLAQQITQDESFEKMKTELIKELFNLEQEKPGRKLNKNNGYDPLNEKEELYKKQLGFLYNPSSIEERLKGLRVEWKDNVNKSTFPQSINFPRTATFSNNFIDDNHSKFLDRFKERFPDMKKLIKEPSQQVISDETLQDLKNKFGIDISSYNENINLKKEDFPISKPFVENIIKQDEEAEIAITTKDIPEDIKDKKSTKKTKRKTVRAIKISPKKKAPVKTAGKKKTKK